jgi:uncharacterized protein YggE
MKYLGCAALVAALGVASCVPATHIHNNFGVSEPANAIVVVGTGEASSVPDIARIALGAEAQNTDAQAAVSDVNQKMKAVIAALKSQGIADRDLRTATLNIFIVEPPPFPMPQPMPDSMPPGRGPPVAPPTPVKTAPTFRASNSLSVTVRHLDRIGPTLGAAIQAGANHAWGIQFELDDPKPLRAKARAKAVEDARARAQELAALSGVKLGRVLSVGELGGDVPPPGMPEMPMSYAKGDTTQSVPIEQGEIKLAYSVRVTFELAR